MPVQSVALTGKGLSDVRLGGMLDVSGFAVFVGRECCVRFFKRLRYLSFPLPFRRYAAVRNYYAAVTAV